MLAKCCTLTEVEPIIAGRPDASLNLLNSPCDAPALPTAGTYNAALVLFAKRQHKTDIVAPVTYLPPETSICSAAPDA